VLIVLIRESVSIKKVFAAESTHWSIECSALVLVPKA
jgi:hypothetical protein